MLTIRELELKPKHTQAWQQKLHSEIVALTRLLRVRAKLITHLIKGYKTSLTF